MDEIYRKWIGRIAIRSGNQDQEPTIVFITGKNNFNLLVSKVINTGSTLFSKPADLIEFDYDKFMIMLYEWRIKQQPERTKRMQKLLAEYKSKA